MNLLAEWRRQVEISSDSPWPGPRPVRTGDDPTALVGRNDDSKKFARMVFETGVVIFTGASGVGKTSMLHLKLVPTLKAAGYQPLVCDDWNRSFEAASIDDLLFAQVKNQLPARARMKIIDAQSLLPVLDSLYPDRGVIILDQFEELIRYQPKQYQAILRWIEKVAVETRVRIVISLRVEYEHELRGHLGLRLGPFQQERYELKPITERSLLAQIIGHGNTRLPSEAISSKASDRLLDAWFPTDDTGSPDRGLLHLQALLLVLWKSKIGPTIEDADVQSLVARLFTEEEIDARTMMPRDGTLLFKRALSEAVQVGLRQCSAACEPSSDGSWQGIDAALTSRAKDFVQAMSGHLSSGGYKVSQAREDLAQMVIFREGAATLSRFASKMEPSRQKLADLVDTSTPTSVRQQISPHEVPDWLSITRAQLSGTEPPEGMPWELDKSEVTAGVVLDLRPEDSLIEEYRSFYFALEWLRLSDMIRLTTPELGTTMVTLIHDLFGDGLKKWSQTSRGIDAAVHQFTSIRGVKMDWKTADGTSSIQDRVVANLRWTFCEVSADFERVTFVNCDFRGTTFVDTLFKGVSFVNCMLDDTEFLECVIEGAPLALPDPDTMTFDQLTKQPSFYIDEASEQLLRSLDWYREPRRTLFDKNVRLFSQTAGVAALPVTHESHPRHVLFESQPGGLAMYGGRLSSLKVRSCRFVDGGRLSLRHVAGTSVEFADQTHARLDVFAAAIRGLTITRPIDADNVSGENPEPLQDPAFDITFTESRLINVWFGIGLRGTAKFDRCRVWQVFNAADGNEFVVEMPPSSKSYGVVNVEMTASSGDEGASSSESRSFAEMGLGEASLGEVREEVWIASRMIDYRQRPARFELEGEQVAGK